MIDLELLKYPIGKFQKPKDVSNQHLKEASAYLGSFPQYLKETVDSFSEEQVNTPIALVAGLLGKLFIISQILI